MKTKYKIGLSILSGLLLSASWPEIGDLTALIFLAFIPLFYIANSLQKKEWRALFIYSFFSFLLWHIITDYWMLYSTLLGSITAWIINSFLMAGVLSLAFHSHKKTKHIPFEIILAFYWLSFEIMHLFWDLSWPWMSLGNVFANNIEWVQWYEYLGIYGGAFWVIIINGFFYRLFIEIKKKNIVAIIWSSILLILFLLIPFSISQYLLQKELSIKSELKISVVQPNFDTYTEKFSGLSPLQQSKEMLIMIEDLKNSIDLLVLPETAIPENIYEPNNTFPLSIELLLEKSKQRPYPILGSYYSYDSTNSYNTAAYIQNGEILETRHKSKLVPFAETMPFEFITKGLRSIIQKEGGTGSTFGRDEFARVFSMNNPTKAKLGTLICFESVFPDLTAEMARNGAEFFIIITNDDWWFDTSGHRQHFAFARLHAISNRRPIARSANTGISGFIDAWGRVLQKSEYREETILTETIVSPHYITFFTQYEYWIRLIILIIGGLLFLGTGFRKFHTNNDFS